MVTLLLNTVAQALPNDFFTTNSITTFAGATGVTYVIANGLQKAFDFNPKWLALAIGILVCEIGAAVSGSTAVVDYLMAIINGFLVFNAAGGITSLSGQPTPLAKQGEREGVGRPAREFSTPWYQ
ncbi:hypothetical protein [Fibrivirga algicola]|uniref:Holin n=1 Tax=Fibrivirga algicola TaxID=2950420 RepID=A0ABX0QKU3_9BACT|nr:hypothetical protein [Fibrivirga algicola]NID11268.1 hypothetical protein [Fibrivirga algicola]